MAKRERRPITRKMINCPVFGAPCNIPDTVLPTNADIVKYFLYVKHDLNLTRPRDAVAIICENIAIKAEELWERASIPVVSHARILQMLRSLHDKYRNILKPFKGRQNDPSYVEKLRLFREKEGETLFDISACKCGIVNITCSCDKSMKVPFAEQAFLHDQRNERFMMIANVDHIATKKLRIKENRKIVEHNRMFKFVQTTATVEKSQLNKSGDELSDESEDMIEESSAEKTASDTDSNVGDSSITSLPLTTDSTEVVSRQLRRELPALARACDRTGVSDRSAAAIASAVLQDFGVISSLDASSVVDRSKVRRERKRKRVEVEHTAVTDIVQGLYFDGRKDKTLVNTKKGNKFYRERKVEEHICLVQQPQSRYIGHVIPKSGSAKEISNSIISFLTQNLVDTKDIIAVGCDGTNTNTGHKAGVIRRLEENFKKPVQWLVCQLHSNELPLRHLLQHLDGVTTGPTGFSGPIGKALANCESLPIAAFSKIDSALPLITATDLSTDQQYLLDICKAVMKGECCDDISRRNPGAMSHARWLTTASRILRLYVASDSPTDNLKTLATFVVKVYCPGWFQIKTNSSCKDGAVNVWSMIKASRYLPDELKCIIDPVIRRNAYFCHPENILLAMVTDDRKDMRELGVRRILKARTQEVRGVRKFTVPDLNFSAEDYISLIDWQTCSITESPLTMELSQTDLERLVASHNVPVLNFPKFPCHTQSVERGVKLVTEACAAVCGEKSRHGFILNRLESRELMPQFNTKSQFRI